MTDARRGDLVQIHKIVLEPQERPENLPPSTKAVPYECWIKGFLLDGKADLGDQVTIETFIGREVSGVLYKAHPKYDHHFGEYQRTLSSVGIEARRQLEAARRSAKG